MESAYMKMALKYNFISLHSFQLCGEIFFSFVIFFLFGFVTVAFPYDDSIGFDLLPEDSITKEKITHYTNLGYKQLPKFTTNGKLNAGKYFAIDDFVIKKGVVVTISDSTSIFFEPGTNLTVEGYLISNGSEASRVVLSNIPDSHLALQRQDTLWNGLALVNGGRVSLTETDINNAWNGIIASNESDSLQLNCVNLNGIRFERIHIANSLKIISDTNCINYCSICKPDVIIPIVPPINKSVHKIRTTALCGAVLFGAASLTSYFISRSYYNKAKGSSSLVDEPEFEKNSNMALTACAVSGGACAVSALTYLFTFTINVKGAASK